MSSAPAQQESSTVLVQMRPELVLKEQRNERVSETTGDDIYSPNENMSNVHSRILSLRKCCCVTFVSLSFFSFAVCELLYTKRN